MQTRIKGIIPKIYLFSIGLIIFIGLSGCNSGQGHYEPLQTTQTQPKKKIKAPTFTLKDLSGESVSLSELKGKVVFLDFWATWCPPCVISAPQIDKLAKEYEGKDIEILSVSVDQNENLVRQFVRQIGIQNRVVMAANSQIDVKYNVSLLPAFYIIDREGYVSSVWKGFHPTMVDSWRKEFDRLLDS